MPILQPSEQYRLSPENRFNGCIDRRAEASSAIYKLRVASLCGHVPVEIGISRFTRLLTSRPEDAGSSWLTVLDTKSGLSERLAVTRKITLVTQSSFLDEPVGRIETNFLPANPETPGVIGTHDCGKSSCQMNSPSILDAEVIDPDLRPHSEFDVDRFITDALTELVNMERASLEISEFQVVV